MVRVHFELVKSYWSLDKITFRERPAIEVDRSLGHVEMVESNSHANAYFSGSEGIPQSYLQFSLNTTVVLEAYQISTKILIRR